MKEALVKNSQTAKFFFDDADRVKLANGAQTLLRDTAITKAQEVVDMFVGSGLSYSQSWFCVFLAESTMREYSKTKPL